MLNKIPFKFAIHLLLIILVSIILFHLLILIQIIPFNIVWGGKLHSVSEMVKFESVSIIVNLFLIVVILIKGEYIRINISQLILNIILWLFVILFALNTIGNLFAESSLETIVFTPLTLIMAVLCLRLILKNK